MYNVSCHQAVEELSSASVGGAQSQVSRGVRPAHTPGRRSGGGGGRGGASLRCLPQQESPLQPESLPEQAGEVARLSVSPQLLEPAAGRSTPSDIDRLLQETLGSPGVAAAASPTPGESISRRPGLVLSSSE